MTISGVTFAVLVAAAAMHPTRGTSGRSTAAAQCQRPYASWSPWNTPLVRAVYDTSADTKLARVHGVLTSDPSQYTYPVYEIGPSTPAQQVRVTDVFTAVRSGGRASRISRGPVVSVPIPTDARPATGSDAQIILLDRRNGDEWGFWQLARDGDSWRATNGYHYNTHWSAVPPRDPAGRPFGSRGAGVPYLTGLIRPCEIARARIDHALAFAYPSPSPEFVYPATKSDGRGTNGLDLPEGTRLGLDASVTGQQLSAWGCTGACLIVARALQRYGMYVIDNSGRPKVMMEYEGTADWHGIVGSKTPSPIPLAALRVIENTTPTVRALDGVGKLGHPIELRYAAFDHGDATRETVAVLRGTRKVATLRRPFHVPVSGRSSVAWRPHRPRPGKYTFCVTSYDPAGQMSAASCATVRLR